MPVNLPTLARNGAVQEISRVKLHAGLVGPDLHDAARSRLINFRRLGQFAPATVEHPVVVVSLALLELVIIVVNARSNGGQLAEIEWRAFHWRQFSPRNEAVIHPRVTACI